jgi:2-dehydro-3-deoxy-D-arabinonate dehydratase
LAPVDDQEVWCTGVTYERTREARSETTPAASFTDLLYASERPELFFKAPGWRARGPGQPIVIRSDSGWDMAEPELGLVITAAGAIAGYLIGNDVTARELERQNPLYLPQAKVYDGACALGPAIVPVDAARPPFELRMVIQRGASVIFEGATSTARMVRSFQDLVGWLLHVLTFPRGVVLLTGCGIVPEPSLTLLAADVVRIEVDGLGVLENPVAEVG